MTKRKRTHDSYEIQEEERYFLNPESVSKHLYCSICQEVFTDPQRAPCGHSFCRKCIMPWLARSSTCPEDRKKILVKQLHHDFILENIIGDQMVACRFRTKGCEYVGQLANLSSHQKRCLFNPENLPDFLKEDSNNSSQTLSDLSVEEDGTLPDPTKPSLKMRLFGAGGKARELLCSMFDKDKNM